MKHLAGGGLLGYLGTLKNLANRGTAISFNGQNLPTNSHNSSSSVIALIFIKPSEVYREAYVYSYCGIICSPSCARQLYLTVLKLFIL